MDDGEACDAFVLVFFSHSLCVCCFVSVTWLSLVVAQQGDVHLFFGTLHESLCWLKILSLSLYLQNNTCIIFYGCDSKVFD